MCKLFVRSEPRHCLWRNWSVLPRRFQRVPLAALPAVSIPVFDAGSTVAAAPHTASDLNPSPSSVKAGTCRIGKSFSPTARDGRQYHLRQRMVMIRISGLFPPSQAGDNLKTLYTISRWCEYWPKIDAPPTMKGEVNVRVITRNSQARPTKPITSICRLHG